jgi:hypothetical protein
MNRSDANGSSVSFSMMGEGLTNETEPTPASRPLGRDPWYLPLLHWLQPQRQQVFSSCGLAQALSHYCANSPRVQVMVLCFGLDLTGLSDLGSTVLPFPLPTAEERPVARSLAFMEHLQCERSIIPGKRESGCLRHLYPGVNSEAQFCVEGPSTPHLSQALYCGIIPPTSACKLYQA